MSDINTDLLDEGKRILANAFQTLEYMVNENSPNKHSDTFWEDEVLPQWVRFLKWDEDLKHLQMLTDWTPPRQEFQSCGSIMSIKLEELVKGK